MGKRLAVYETLLVEYNIGTIDDKHIYIYNYKNGSRTHCVCSALTRSQLHFDIV